ncbi:hypothetical protein ACOSQ3_018395 [Xanthoceras sorbifolium]
MGFQFLVIVAVFTIITVAEGNIRGGGGEVCNPNDLRGLTSFKAEIHTDTSGRSAKWVGRSCCRWEGISCDNATGRVTEIRLPGFISTEDSVFQSQMEGRLSPSVTLLTSLEVLDLGGLIGLAGTIPPLIGYRLQNLKKLYLYGNKLNGPVPESIEKIGELQVLEELDFSSNLLRGKIPPSLANLTTISVLYLDNNYLEGAIPFPSRYGQMPSLGFLRLQNNHLSGRIPPNFGYLVSLQRVSLANNKLEGAIPASLGNLQDLTELYLNGNLISGYIPKPIGRLSRLMFLSVSHNLIQGELPYEMSSLQNLQTVDLSFNLLNLSSIPKWLAELPSLSRMYLAGCGIKGEIPEFLRTTPSPIQELDLSVNQLIGSIPAWFGSLTQLYSLNLSKNSLVSKIPETITNLQDLGVLDLHSNKLTGSVSQVFKIGQRFPDGSLTYIDLSDNGFSSGIELIGEGAQTGIQYLNLSHNFLEGRLPISIGRLKSLRSLDVSCNKLGSVLPDALANESSLETLKLQENRFTGKIPNEFLKLRKLKDLNLSDNLLEGEIPAGKPLSEFPVSSFSGNTGLCGKPLTPCKA